MASYGLGEQPVSAMLGVHVTRRKGPRASRHGLPASSLVIRDLNFVRSSPGTFEDLVVPDVLDILRRHDVHLPLHGFRQLRYHVSQLLVVAVEEVGHVIDIEDAVLNDVIQHGSVR